MHIYRQKNTKFKYNNQFVHTKSAIKIKNTKTVDNNLYLSIMVTLDSYIKSKFHSITNIHALVILWIIIYFFLLFTILVLYIVRNKLKNKKYNSNIILSVYLRKKCNTRVD